MLPRARNAGTATKFNHLVQQGFDVLTNTNHGMRVLGDALAFADHYELLEPSPPVLVHCSMGNQICGRKFPPTSY